MYKIICTNKLDGNMSYKYGNREIVSKNKDRIFNKYNIDKKILMIVNNKDDIVFLDKYTSDEINADSIITNLKNVFIYLNYGDCIPMIVYDRKKDIISYTHLGWKSIELELHKKVINYFINNIKSNMYDLNVVIGPSIKKDSYILKEPIQLNNKKWDKYLELVKDNYYKVDLNKYIIDSLLELGIDSIDNSSIDTVKDLNYFSHYRVKYIDSNEIEGRFMYGVYLL